MHTHSINSPTVCSCYFLLLTLAVFQPSVRDIDVSRTGLQGTGRREGVRVRIYLWDVAMHFLSSLFRTESGDGCRDLKVHLDAGLF